MSQLPIDLDTESVQFDGNWYTRDELARRIKAMLDSNDYQISRPSAALEQLTSTLTSLRTLAFRATPEMADALNASAARAGRTVGTLIREAVSEYLGLPNAGSAASDGSERVGTPAGQRTTPVETPAAAVAAQAQVIARAPEPPPPAMPKAPPGLVTHTAPAPAAPIAGPGAVRAAEPARAPQPVQSPVPSAVPSVVVEDVAADDAANPVDLNVKKKDEEAIERRWFGG